MQAVNVTDDIGTMVFIIGDGPRPIEADVARPGSFVILLHQSRSAGMHI